MTRVLIAASGSGGHLMPALYIAEALRELEPKVEIHFIGSGRPLERELIDRRGFVRHELAIVGLKNRGVLGLLQFLGLLPKALTNALRIFAAYQPQVVIGVGGYVSVLPVVLASIKGIPSWIHEAELHPGMANNFLRIFATKISVVFPQAELARSDKSVITGHPVRPGLAEAVAQRPPPAQPKRLLILGGSQGAKAIDAAMLELTPLLSQHALEVQHQCRTDNQQALSSAYQLAGIAAQVSPFIHDLNASYAWADLILSRSGAGACAEISIVNKPTILVPYPHAQAGHQLANAKIIVEAGKALLCEEGPGFSQRLQVALEQLLAPAAFSSMQAAPALQREQSAARMIAAGVLKLLEP